MPHFKVSDDSHSHPKAIMAGDAAWGMWNRAGCWSMAYGTDGFVPEWWVKQQPQGTVKAKALIGAQLWRRGEYEGDRPEYQGQKGYTFHEWRQDSYEKVEADRKKARDRMKSARSSPDVRPEQTPNKPRSSPERPGIYPLPITQKNSGYVSQDDSRPERDPEIVADTPNFGDDVPEFIETAAKPAKRHPSSAAKTVVRQVLGSAGYPNSTLERLAVQVDKLAPHHPDSLIRQALIEWDRRPNCERPEFLETVLGDLIKASRAASKTAAADEKVNGWLALATPDPRTDSSPPHVHSDTRKAIK